MALQGDSKVLIGGNFTIVNEVPRARVARLHGAEAPPALGLSAPRLLPDGRFSFRLSGEPGRSCTIQISSDLVRWVDWKTVVSSSASPEVIDSRAGSASQRFYRFKLHQP
jgi:hypothetical protein